MALPLKKFYTDMASILIPLAIFAGGMTLATQFIIQYPNTRLQALLALASQLFLATPLTLLPVYLVLYDLKDEDSISYESQTPCFCLHAVRHLRHHTERSVCASGYSHLRRRRDRKGNRILGTGAANFVVALGHRHRNGRNVILEVAAVLARDQASQTG